ncbi:MAG TPA: TetR/AcrR family transcriptional regulator [Solirubrobacterales bacterium]|jgi:AcrR family transcriptional regulator
MAVEPLTLLTHAVGPDAAPPDDATSNRILDAALDLAAASGVQHLTMDAVARRAHVGRMTVYRRFGDKQALVAALGAREGRRCLAELDAAAEPDAPIAEQVAAGFATSLRLAREHPLLSRLARLEPETVLGALTEDGGALFAVARAYLERRLRESQLAGVLGPIEVGEAAELLVRLAVSFVLIPESVLPLEDEDRVRELARQLLAPILEG